MKKTYGNEKTDLTLTMKAEAYYSVTDPISIIQTGENEYTIDDCGDIREGLTEAEVNEMLEERYDAGNEDDGAFCTEAKRIRFYNAWTADGLNDDHTDVEACLEWLQDESIRTWKDWQDLAGKNLRLLAEDLTTMAKEELEAQDE